MLNLIEYIPIAIAIQPKKYKALILTSQGEAFPSPVAEAYARDDAPRWKQAIEQEVKVSVQGYTWIAEKVRPGATVIDSRFVFIIKKKPDGTIERYKARLVDKGFQEKYTTDVYAPVIDFDVIRTAIACMTGRR